MGLSFSVPRFLSFFSYTRKARILMLGLDGAGKTTALYRLRLGEVVTTVPTIGFNVETVKHSHVEFTIWDVGGQDKIRPLWRHYLLGTNGLVFIIDSADKDRIDDAHDELALLLNQSELDHAAVLVLANKQDLPHAMTVTEITTKLDLGSLGHNRPWMIQECSAVTGEGMVEGFDWLASQIAKRR
eukprot:c9590_g2_i1.p1 GENE.c9590_g2_i1~~c9590_g2_i1.p1  ORF type:complete len:185 (+),score=24.71 c9590_g2_i1:100-654(+)